MKRDYSIDLLRIMAVFCVMVLHVAANRWSLEAVGSFEWEIINFFDCIVQFCVPIFFMISGCMLLNPAYELSWEKLYKVKILRIVTAFIFWSVLYAGYFLSVEIDQGMEKYELLINFVRRCITGQYHLWFLFAIVGLYMVTPVLREIAKNVELTKYILVLGFIFALTMPLLGSLPWGDFLLILLFI